MNNHSEIKFQLLWDETGLALLESFPDLVWCTDGQGQYIYFNHAWLEFAGKNFTAESGDDWLNGIHPIDRQSYDRISREAFQKRESFQAEIRLLHADGKYRWICKYGRPIYDQNKNFLGYIGSGYDITESKQREATINKLSLAIEQSPNMVIITDIKGNIEYVNPQFTKSTGYRLDEVLGKNPRILKSGETPEAEYGRLWNTLLGGGVWKGEFCNRRKNGDLYWELAAISPIRDYDHQITHFLAVKEDITERKRFEKELQQAKEAAEAANRTKSEFLANISHEIRTPMNGIIGMTRLALDTDLTAEQRQYLEMVKLSADSLLTIINNILDISKIEAGKMDLDRSDFHLVKLIDETIGGFRLRAAAKGLKLECQLDPDIPKMIIGDAGRLKQIVINLMDNALKFSETGTISLDIRPLRIGRECLQLRFAISDTGIGIPGDRLQLLFKKFSQIDGSTTWKYGGTGLGLAICKELVEMMNGTIWVESRESQGSIFYFTAEFQLPVIPIPDDCWMETTCGELSVSRSPALHYQAKILVAEDNLVNQKLISALLEKRGWQVRAVPDGLQVLQMLNAERFDLLLLDIQMVEMDGFEVAARIRAQERGTGGHLPIISLTAHAMKGDRERCLAAGMDDYLSKPVEAVQLYQVIDRQLNRYWENSPADLTVLMKNIAEDRSLMKELIATFRHNWPQRLEMLHNALRQEDLGRLKALVHEIKGMALNFGAGKSVNCLKYLENLCRAQDWATAKEFWDSLADAFCELDDHLENLRI